jgi:D-hexose-6-phosphate mutarotase
LSDLEVVNSRISKNSQIRFRRLVNGLVLAEIDTPLATASVSLHGGHVVSWRPKHQLEPVLWLSKSAHFQSGKAIRGGVPICWPWFGAHPGDSKLPSHGYARISPWEIVAIDLLDGGEIEINLTLPANDLSRAHWPDGVNLSIQITVGEALKVVLTTDNQSERDIVLTEGLHTYFQIGDIDRIRVRGLEGCDYVDLVDGNARKRQTNAIVFEGELGRIYENSEATCLIEDVMLNRRIRIEKSGSQSTAVWNPWSAKAATMDDMGRDGWKEMVCVESANALGDVVTVNAHESHSLVATYSVESL